MGDNHKAINVVFFKFRQHVHNFSNSVELPLDEPLSDHILRVFICLEIYLEFSASTV